MFIVGSDYHPSFQQIAHVDTETGELREQRLVHREGAEEFYSALAATGQRVCVGMEASGHARWFERLLAELNIELQVGDAAEIRRKRGRKQKTDRQDAQHILGLLLKNDFPPTWVPSWANRDLRQLLCITLDCRDSPACQRSKFRHCHFATLRHREAQSGV
jgi:transposase